MKRIFILVMLVAATALSASAQDFASNSPAEREYRRYREIHRQQEVARQRRKLERRQARMDREFYKTYPVPNVTNGELPMPWTCNNPYRPFWPADLSNDPAFYGVTNLGNIVYYNCYQGIQGILIADSYYIVTKYSNMVSLYRGNTLMSEIRLFSGIQTGWRIAGGSITVDYVDGVCHFYWHAPNGTTECYTMY